VDYQQLRNEVLSAFRGGDFPSGYSLLDQHVSTTHGDHLGQVLILKASMIASFDFKRIPEGLVLIDEALPLVRHDQGATARALKTAMAMVYLSGDAERAGPYEESACRLLLEYGSQPEVRTERFGLQLNLGLVASVRGDHATAYWYLVQAANSISAPEVSEERRKTFEFHIQTNIALSCLRVRRYYEAQEALDQAEACGHEHPQRLRVPVYRSELFRKLGQPEAAKALLATVRDQIEPSDNPDIQAWYYWIAALVAQDLSDLADYHRNLAKAQAIAANHHFDYLLGEMQRLNRSTRVM
jgi:hypothetical protein